MRPSALFASVRAGCAEIDGARKRDGQQPADADGSDREVTDTWIFRSRSGVHKRHTARKAVTARAGAVKARTQAGNWLRDLTLTAPEQVRRQLAGLPPGRQADVAARFRPHGLAGPAAGFQALMATVARRPYVWLPTRLRALACDLYEILDRLSVRRWWSG
jgi:hypothetical protein